MSGASDAMGEGVRATFDAIHREERDCPVCGTSSRAAKVFVEERIDPATLDGFAFASRKIPEFMSHRLVRCPSCDLIYADRPPSQDVLAIAYHVADYDSTDEADDAAQAYVRAIEPVLARLRERDAALEIGAGTGVFLQRLYEAGFATLVGVEPSTAAIAAAPEQRRAWLREAIFDERDFEPESFDLVCCFMTLEHVRDPDTLARAAHRLLRSGGALVTVTHDHRSLVNRLLGRRSPIVDIEHMQLFGATSVERLFASAGFRDVGSRSFVNRYALPYWFRLAPLPAGWKRRLDRMLRRPALARIKIGVNVGNRLAWGFKA